MGLLEPITHKEEIESLLNEAQSMYDNAKNKFESQKKQTTKRLENLGKVKVNAWTEGMDSFVTAFGTFKNVEMDRRIDSNMDFIGSDEEPKQMLMNIQNASMTANEVAKAGFAALGTGALVGIASYGGAMMFGTASTGTAIAALSGAAKTNATLAWFGGGAKAAGGLGMAGGKLILAGVVVAPIVAVAAVIAGAKGKEKLAEAKKIHAEAEEAVSQMNIMTTGMEGIAKMSDNYSSFIKKLNKKFAPFLQELERIKNSHPVDADGMIDFDSLSIVEQKTLHVSWLMAQVYYHVLSTPILNSKGEVSSEAREALSASTNASYVVTCTREIIKNANLNAAEYDRMTAILLESAREMDEYHEEFKKHVARCEERQRKMFDRFIDTFEYNLETGENYDQAIYAICQFADEAGIALQYVEFDEFSRAMKSKESFVLK